MSNSSEIKESECPQVQWVAYGRTDSAANMKLNQTSISHKFLSPGKKLGELGPRLSYRFPELAVVKQATLPELRLNFNRPDAFI